jgi:hypothetical protein
MNTLVNKNIFEFHVSVRYSVASSLLSATVTVIQIFLHR